MNKTLFDLSNEILQLDDLLDSLDGDDEAQMDALDEYLNGLESDLEAKLDNYAGFITELEARSCARKEEAERLAHRAKVDANKAARLKESLKVFFGIHGYKTMETDRFKLTLSANGGKLPLMISSIEDLPEQYVEQVVTLKALTDAIRNDIESGIDVPGCMLGERGSSMRIR